MSGFTCKSIVSQETIDNLWNCVYIWAHQAQTIEQDILNREYIMFDIYTK